MILNEKLVTEAVVVAHGELTEALYRSWPDLSDDERRRATECVRLAIEHYLTHRTLPDRMREAADTLEETGVRKSSDAGHHFSGGYLRGLANTWEAEDRARAEQDELVAEITELMFADEDTYESKTRRLLARFTVTRREVAR